MVDMEQLELIYFQNNKPVPYLLKCGVEILIYPIRVEDWSVFYSSLTVFTIEKEELKAKNNEMAEMLKQMQEQMKNMQAQMNMQNQTQPNIILEQNKDITRTIKVTSLVGNILTLS